MSAWADVVLGLAVALLVLLSHFVKIGLPNAGSAVVPATTFLARFW